MLAWRRDEGNEWRRRGVRKDSGRERERGRAREREIVFLFISPLRERIRTSGIRRVSVGAPPRPPALTLLRVGDILGSSFSVSCSSSAARTTRPICLPPSPPLHACPPLRPVTIARRPPPCPSRAADVPWEPPPAPRVTDTVEAHIPVHVAMDIIFSCTSCVLCPCDALSPLRWVPLQTDGDVAIIFATSQNISQNLRIKLTGTQNIQK